MENCRIYEDIARRTNGDIYIGVVGPVRTGKSTFIKRFMETLVIPEIEDVYMKERAKDELPQSGSGRTIMTAEPKFVPEEAVNISVSGSAELSVRMIDCVGYIVDGAMGHMEDGEERMVATPWLPEEVPMTQAAEIGTKKVITEHSTIGIVVTTDGSVTDIERSAYEQAEERVINEMRDMGKPFVVLLNSANPDNGETVALRDAISYKYGVSCLAVNCMTLNESEIRSIIYSVLQEFPVYEMGFCLPSWIEALDIDNPIKAELYSAIKSGFENANYLKDVDPCIASIRACECVSSAEISEADMGTGKIRVQLELPRELFYSTIREVSGFDISDEGDIISLMGELASVKREYDKVAKALYDVNTSGYGIVMPDMDELILQEPEIVKKNGRYSVKLKAAAPTIHMIKTDIETEVSPAVGGESASGDIINFLLQEFEGDTGKIWESNIFGKSLHEIAGDGLQSKIKNMATETQSKLRDALSRIINDGAGGLICIIL